MHVKAVPKQAPHVVELVGAAGPGARHPTLFIGQRNLAQEDVVGRAPAPLQGSALRPPAPALAVQPSSWLLLLLPSSIIRLDDKRGLSTNSVLKASS